MQVLIQIYLLLSFFFLVRIQIAAEHNIRFFETSAKANINIEKAFLMLAEDILQKVSPIKQRLSNGFRKKKRFVFNRKFQLILYGHK